MVPKLRGAEVTVIRASASASGNLQLAVHPTLHCGAELGKRTGVRRQ